MGRPTDRDKEIIRAAAFVECAALLDTCAMMPRPWASQAAQRATRVALSGAADLLRDRAFEIRRKFDTGPHDEIHLHIDQHLPDSLGG